MWDTSRRGCDPNEYETNEWIRTRNEISGGDGQDDYDHGYERNRYDCGFVGCYKSFVHEHVGIKTDTHDGLLVAESQVATSLADPV